MPAFWPVLTSDSEDIRQAAFMKTADVAPAMGRKRFGSNMHSLRRAKGLSQEKLGEACHLHRTYIGSVERGERNISIDNMERIAAGLGTEVADMLRTS